MCLVSSYDRLRYTYSSSITHSPILPPTAKIFLSWANAVRVTLHFNKYVSFHNHETEEDTSTVILRITDRGMLLQDSQSRSHKSESNRTKCLSWMDCNHKRVLKSSDHIEYCICTVCSAQGWYLQTATNASDSETVIDHAIVSVYIVAKMSVHV
jgi:hypothetical protein